jgi:hypothetical protein
MAGCPLLPATLIASLLQRKNKEVILGLRP